MLPYEIEPEALHASLQNSGDGVYILVDVREFWEVQTAPMPGALLMPMGDVPSRAHSELDPDARIVAVCHHGVRSLSVTAWLRREGFEQAQSLAGGMDAWSARIDPSVPRY